jgi:tetratricopeptide (TPR) repeat protein
MVFRIHSLRLHLAAYLGAAMVLVGAASAQQPRDYSISESTNEVLGTAYKQAADAKDFDKALAVINAQLEKLTDKTSFDAAVLNQIKAQTLLQKSQFTQAIEPLERSLQLSDAKSPTYFDERNTQEMLLFLSQLYFQEATTVKDTRRANEFYDRSERYIERWVKNNTRPNPDAMLFYASLLYNRAVQDADNPDKARLTRALDVVDQAMRMSIHPKDNLWVLKLVCLQQLDRNDEAVEFLELVVAQKPDNRNYWQQLAALYLGQGQDVRAIVTFERAQKVGFLNSPRDNFNLVGIHFNIGQFERAAELLEKGLVEGSIENEQKNWELLAYSYQQVNRDFKAIDALKRATKQFPQSGQLEYLIAQAYYSMEKYEDALPHLQAAVRKDGGTRPHQTLLFLAFVAYELKKYEIALDAANRALKFPEGETEALRMKQAVEDMIREREAKLQKS